MDDNEAVMGQLQKQRTPAPRMEVYDIIAQNLQGTNTDPARVYETLVQLVKKDPKFRIMRANNSLFMYYNLGDGNVEIVMETTDTPRALVESVESFIQAMNKAGFKSGTFEISNPQIVKVLKMAGAKFDMQPSGKLLPDGQTPAMIGKVEF
jgi:acylphosphatase